MKIDIDGLTEAELFTRVRATSSAKLSAVRSCFNSAMEIMLAWLNLTFLAETQPGMTS